MMKCNRKMFCFLLALVFMVGLVPVSASEGSQTEEYPPLTYHDVDYEPERPQEQEDPYAPSYSAELPAFYVSPDATKPKNQGSYGTCWAFAATSSAEGSFNSKSGGENDLSELQLAYYFYQPKIDPLDNASGDKTTSTQTGLNAGGNNYFTMFALANWTNGARESTLPYSGDYLTKADGGTLGNAYATDYVAHLQDARIIPYSASDTDIKNVKEAIQQYSTLSCSMKHLSDYYNSATGAYCTNQEGTNHAVSIVGWNDDYPLENFNENYRPAKNGAWLMKNSWGSNWGTDGDADPAHSGQEGYFWLSYYDESLISSGAVFAFAFDSADTYTCNYQYDGSCGLKSISIDDSTQVAAIYTVKGLESDQERIDAVGLWLASTNVSGTVSIYTGVQGNAPLSGKLAATKLFSTTYAGFYTIALDDAPVVTKGEQYSVVVDFNGVCDLFVDCTYENGGWIQFTADTTNDRTYSIQSDGTATDLKTSGCTARIKAYTNPIQYAASLTLKDNMDVNYCVRVPHGINVAQYSVQSTFAGSSHTQDLADLTPTVETISGKDWDVYKVTVAEAYSYQMTFPITIEVYKGTDCIKTVENYSVMQYCNDVMKEQENTDSLYQLCAAVLQYGGSAQRYFDGKSYGNGVEYVVFPDEEKVYADNGMAKPEVENPMRTLTKTEDLEGFRDFTASLILGNETALKLYFYYDGATALGNDAFSCAGKTVNGPYATGEANGYYVTIPGIKARELGKNFELTVQQGEKSMKVTVSAFGYASSKWKDEGLAELCMSLVNYGQKVQSYIGE